MDRPWNLMGMRGNLVRDMKDKESRGGPIWTGPGISGGVEV